MLKTTFETIMLLQALAFKGVIDVDGTAFVVTSKNNARLRDSVRKSKLSIYDSACFVRKWNAQMRWRHKVNCPFSCTIFYERKSPQPPYFEKVQHPKEKSVAKIPIRQSNQGSSKKII